MSIIYSRAYSSRGPREAAAAANIAGDATLPTMTYERSVGRQGLQLMAKCTHCKGRRVVSIGRQGNANSHMTLQ